MKVQSFPCTKPYLASNTVLHDKVKCPSVTEVGFTGSTDDGVIPAGTIYPIFGNALIPVYNTNTLTARFSTDGYYRCYWTRSPYYTKYSVTSVWIIVEGHCTDSYWYYPGPAVGIIRF